MSKKLARPPKKTKAADVQPLGYRQFLNDISKKIRIAQSKATLSAAQELTKLYWDIGKSLVEKQEKEKWGSQIIEKFARDIQNEFPGIEGFSRANIFYMRAFFLAYCNCPTAVGRLKEEPPKIILNIPWGHNIILITRLKNNEQRLWYAHKALECGWSRSSLEDWIKSDLFIRQGEATTNFHVALPKSLKKSSKSSIKTSKQTRRLKKTKRIKK